VETTSYEIKQFINFSYGNTEELLELMIKVEDYSIRESIEDHFLIAIKYGSVDEYIDIFSNHLKNLNFVYEGVSLDEHRFHIMDDELNKFMEGFEVNRLAHIFNLLRDYTVQNMSKH